MALDRSGRESRSKGPGPMDALLLAVAGCMAVDVQVILERSRVPLTGLEVEVEGERAPTHPKRYTRIHMAYYLEGPRKKHQGKVERAVELSREKFCSVLHSLRPDISLEIDIQRSIRTRLRVSGSVQVLVGNTARGHLAQSETRKEGDLGDPRLPGQPDPGSHRDCHPALLRCCGPIRAKTAFRTIVDDGFDEISFAEVLPTVRAIAGGLGGPWGSSGRPGRPCSPRTGPSGPKPTTAPSAPVSLWFPSTRLSPQPRSGTSSRIREPRSFCLQPENSWRRLGRPCGLSRVPELVVFDALDDRCRKGFWVGRISWRSGGRKAEETIGESSGRRPFLPSPDDTATILYTSGTTGRPKGSGPDPQQPLLERQGPDHRHPRR